ncbi:MAG: penicillin-insensitive murein endopeptidase [Myxococcales bacterium]|nr:penicillin-insensitive murein endopeptidase [Myxococcales bacterium]
MPRLPKPARRVFALLAPAAAAVALFAPQLARADGYCGPGRTRLRHEVQKNETVSEIAEQHGVTTKSILYHNPDLDPKLLRVGQRVNVCIDDAVASAPVKTAGNGDRGKAKTKVRCGRGAAGHVHTVESGDSLSGIASRYGVTEADIKAKNPAVKKQPNLLQVGQEIEVCVEEKRLTKSKLCNYETPLFTHKAVPGDNASRIAARYGVMRKDLYRLNAKLRQNPNSVAVGQEIKVCPDIAPRELIELTHTVQQGESAGVIAEKYGILVAQLEAFQRKGAVPDINKLRVGQKLRVWTEGSYVPGFGGYEDDSGVLTSGVQLPDGAGYIVKHPTLSYGTEKTIRLIQGAISRYRGAASGGPKVHVGDISKRGGGKFPPHKSHQHGRDVDMGYVLKGELADEIKFRSANEGNLDVRRTWALIKSFLDTGEVRYIFMDYSLQKLVYEYARAHGVGAATLEELFQYPRGRGRTAGIIRHSRGHKNHFHVRFHK